MNESTDIDDVKYYATRSAPIGHVEIYMNDTSFQVISTGITSSIVSSGKYEIINDTIYLHDTLGINAFYHGPMGFPGEFKRQFGELIEL